ncbi:acyl-CoA carboxylase epsilon subunit [Amycolatopsis sp. NPDC052450]|uniref:acyl-CoA carboxylase epsilon subunit n=1 Tax=Amycolatopsis sp. NPDC052450 TaxID=3363937 RepID=UPI0037C88171
MSREAVTLEIVRGRPEPDELAALVAVLAARREVTVVDEPRIGRFAGISPRSWSSRPIPGWRTTG